MNMATPIFSAAELECDAMHICKQVMLTLPVIDYFVLHDGYVACKEG